MSIPVLETCKKRKRRPKLYNFRSFGEPGCPINPTGQFRDNIRVFLQQCAEPEDYNVDGMPTSCTLLLIENKSFVVPLYTIEEDVKHSTKPFCDQCRCNGWSNNFVSKRKYHMIIPFDAEWNKRLEDDVFDLHTHLLHGLIHCNGFGHLLCINGMEAGSKYLRGREIMDLWDRICENLRARKITVEDVSKKRAMDLRLLYGVAYGHSWFGRWGYKFSRGSFGVTELNYVRAIEILSYLELDKIVEDFCDMEQCKGIKQIICHYRNLSETQLTTFRDLLRFMLTVKSCPCTTKKQSRVASAPSSTSKSFTTPTLQKKPLEKEKCIRYRKFSTLVGTLDSRWPVRRLEYAAGVIVDALKLKKEDRFSQGGMTRQDVRDAARMHIGDTGLLDYVLKSMNNVIVGSYVVHRAVNPKTRILEYSIDELAGGVRPIRVHEPEEEIVRAPLLAPGADAYSDLAYLYVNVLLNYPASELVELAAQAILDCKHFVKEWPFKDEKDQLLRLLCRVLPNLNDLVTLSRKSPPGEIVVLPLNATVMELKRAVKNALRDTYCVLEKFVVTDIEHMEELEDRDFLYGAVESGAEIFVRGNGVDLNTHLIYEGGLDNWKVRCECGAEDDDGERMVSCDICEVWQHTRCNGIEDSQTVPPLFICLSCCDSIMPSRRVSQPELENPDDFLITPSTEYGPEPLCQGMVLECH